jgi:hypothetical protein
MSKNSIQIDKTVENLIFIRGKVREYLEKFGHLYIQNIDSMSDEDQDHIVSIGTSIIGTRLEIGFPGGSFVQAIVNNDLRGAFASADSINVNCIRFYVMMIYNLNLDGLYQG